MSPEANEYMLEFGHPELLADLARMQAEAADKKEKVVSNEITPQAEPVED